jgi:GntR family transcriptional regulator
VNSLPYLSPRDEGQADAWSEETARAGRVGTQKIREVTTDVPPADVASALELPPDAQAVVRRRTMLLDACVRENMSWTTAGTSLPAARRPSGRTSARWPPSGRPACARPPHRRLRPA